MSAPTTARATTGRVAELLDAVDGRFAAYAVPSRSGPHLTMQAGVIHAGRFWTTTSQQSLKARSVRAHCTAGVVVDEDGATRILAGRTNRLRPFRPLDALSDPVAPWRSTSAVVRLGVDQLEQLVGYFEAARRIPDDWLPHRRVLLVTRIDRSLALEGLEVVAATGDWAGDTHDHVLDVTGDRPVGLPLHRLPDTHGDVVRVDRPVHLAIQTPDGPVALPARWRGENGLEVATGALRAVRAALPGRAAATFDDSQSRRPDEKLGVMFRGRAALVDVDGPRATVLVQPERITTWDGFSADTRAVG